MKLAQLETERTRYNALVQRMKALEHVIAAEREGNVIDAAQQALGMVNSERGVLVVKSLIAALVAEEVASLAEAGGDFDMHDYFPEVVFTGTDYASREEGGPEGFVHVAPGAEASIVRALKHMGSVGGEYGFDERGGIQFTVSRKQLVLPQVASISVPPAAYKLAGDGKGLQE